MWTTRGQARGWPVKRDAAIGRDSLGRAEVARVAMEGWTEASGKMASEAGHRSLQEAEDAELDAAIRQAARVVEEADSVLVASHAHPDGDAIGASLALGHLLTRLGKRVTIFNVHPVPYNFRFLPGADSVVDTLDSDASFALTCVLDCSNRAQLGAAFPPQGWGAQVLAIDHHQGRFEHADYRLQDPHAAAVGELVYRLAQQLGVEVDSAIAQCVYCSLMADTGCFRYSSTTSMALRVAAEMVEHGVDVWRMASQVYENNPIERIVLLGRVLKTLWISPCKRVAAVRVTRRMLRDTRADEPMIDGFINHARSIRGVEVAVQLREVGTNHFYVSFRTRGNINVAQIAEQFGGGGSHHAAGCEMKGRWRELVEQLAERLEQMCPAHQCPETGPHGAASDDTRSAS